VLLCISSAALMLAVAAVASAGAPGSWTKVTDPGSNVDELGLARSPDGVLHVAWPKKAASGEAIWQTRITPGGVVAGKNPISDGWNGSASGPALLAMPSGLRVLFAGLGKTNESGGIQSASAGSDGGTWKLEPGRVSTDVNAAGTVGAALRQDGTPIFAWTSGTQLFVHEGLDSAQGEQQIGPSPACCFYEPALATDTATGVTTLAYSSNVSGKPGLFVRTVKPGLGATTLVPKSLTGKDFAAPDLRLPLVAREGGGVFLAYCGGYPTCKQVYLWRVTGGVPSAVTSATYVEDVNASRGPEGRIWVMWWNRDVNQIFASRSNKKATVFGPIVSTKLPPGSDHVWKLFGEGSVGPLDVFASAGSPSVYWHTQLLPKLVVHCARLDKDTISCTVTDAGDPVPGTSVKFAGQTKTTTASGTATFTSTATALTATASKKGYSNAG
jgi:hypothetical protein